MNKTPLNITATITASQLVDIIEDYIQREHANYKVSGIEYKISQGNFQTRPSLNSVEVKLIPQAPAARLSGTRG